MNSYEAGSIAEQICSDLDKGDVLWSPSQMVAALKAEAATRAKAVQNAEDGHVGTAGAQLTKDLVFTGRSSSLYRGARALLTRGSFTERDDILVSIKETTKQELVVFPGYIDPKRAHVIEGAEEYVGTGVSASVATYNELPPVPEKELRRYLEKGYSSGGFVAMDINVQSHVGQKTPLVAYCAIMDSYTNDFAESMQVGWYMNLAEGTCKVLSLPLVNFPLSKELDLADDYLKRLYLVSYFYNSRGFRKNKPMFSYGIIGFSEFKPTVNNNATRVALEWDSVQKNQIRGERVVSGLNLLTTIQKEHEVEIPDIPKSEWKCKPPTSQKPIIQISSHGLRIPSMASMRGGSFKVPALPLGLSGRTSVDLARPVVKQWGEKSSNCCSVCYDGKVQVPGHSCEAQGNAGEVIANDPFLLDATLPNPSTYVQQGFAEIAPVHYLKSNETSHILEEEVMLKIYHVDVKTSDLKKGYIPLCWDVTAILSGQRDNKYQDLISYTRSGNFKIYLKVTVTAPVNMVGLFKVVYDGRSAIRANSTDYPTLAMLPGCVFDGVKEKHARLEVDVPRTHAIGGITSFYFPLGGFVVGCLSDFTAGSNDVFTVALEAGICNASNLMDNAYGNASYLVRNGMSLPENIYVGAQMINQKITVSSPTYAQWRVPIVPYLTYWEGGKFFPGPSSTLLEHHMFWQGRVFFRVYIASPPLSSGKFLVSFLPPGDIETIAISSSRLKGHNKERYMFPGKEIDISVNHHAYFSVDFGDWRKHFPTGLGFDAHATKNARDFPWMVITQLTRLTSQDKTYNTFRVFVELVEIANCKLIGPSWVPPTRVVVPTSLGNAEAREGNWHRLAYLSDWAGNSTWAIPIGPQVSQYAIQAGYVGANSPNNFLRHRANETLFWSGTITYRVRIEEHLPVWATYSSQPLLKFAGKRFYGATDFDISGGSAQVFTLPTMMDLELEIKVPMSEIIEKFSTQTPTSLEQSLHAYNGWIFIHLPEYPSDPKPLVNIDVKISDDFCFYGNHVGGNVLVSTDVNMPIYGNGFV